ncbi:cutinase family protein [Rhodococcus chondri]|uniref:PE-PPE domain-containing protein n=1 Tax=Rhodococcus chondri TaxID=3065941 RepID=A0ABU7JRL8_9NOCA|nr:PE-PPE domain-containing protein [Rhodococcus sp. CC-R104]MEE2032655.1 PE-PPE domain-containing protein [Rhodococcus sp. CC-R104]
MRLRRAVKRAGAILGVAAVVVLAGSTSVPAAASPPGPESCPPMIVFGVDGTLKVGKPTSTVHPILAAVADRGMRTVRIGYPGEISPIGTHTYNRSKEIGVDELHRQVALAHAECPIAALRVVGFSQGAAIAGDVLAELAHDIDRPDDLAGLLIADPRTPDTGAEVVAPGALAGISLTGARDGFGTVPVATVCAVGDAVCDMVDPRSDPLEAARRIEGYFAVHQRYSELTVDGRSFVDAMVDLVEHPRTTSVRLVN